MSTADTKELRALSDEELVAQILKSRQPQLFEIIYDRYVDKVFRKCISFTTNRDEAQDLAHDVFIKIYTSLVKFQGRSKFSTWVYAITYNKCVDYQKAKKKRNLLMSELAEAQLREKEEPSDEDLFAIRADHLMKALDLLDPNDKALLLMKYQDKQSLKNIMQLLGISESAVKMRLKRSKQRLLKLIDEEIRISL